MEPSPESERRLTSLQLYSPRPKPKYGDPLVDAGWTTGGEETDGGRVPYLAGPNAHMNGTSECHIILTFSLDSPTDICVLCRR